MFLQHLKSWKQYSVKFQSSNEIMEKEQYVFSYLIRTGIAQDTNMNHEKRSLKKLLIGTSANQLAFFNILVPIILNGVNFFTVPVFTRLLGTENYGIISLYTTWVQILTIIMGIQTCGTISTARVHIDEKEHDAYYSSILSLSCLVSAGMTLLILLFINPISSFLQFNKIIVLLIIVQSFGAYVISFATMKFIHHKQAHLNFLVSVTVTVLSIVISLLLIMGIDRYEDRYWGRIIGYVIPNAVIGAILAILIFAKGKKGYSKEYWKFCLPLCMPLVLHSLSQIILAQSDKVMLQKMLLDNSAVGIYSFVFNFVHIINVIYGALNNTWVPLYYDHMKNGELEAIQKRSKNYIALYTVLTMGFMLLAPEVVKLFASEEFWSGTNLIPIMSLSFYMVFLYSFPVNYEFFYKKTRVIALGTCLAAVCNIVVNFFMIPVWGILGASLATMISYVMLFVFHQIMAKFVVKEAVYHYQLRIFIPGLAAVIVTSALFYLLFDFWYLRWIIGAALGCYLLFRLYKQRSIF